MKLILWNTLTAKKTSKIPSKKLAKKGNLALKQPTVT